MPFHKLAQRLEEISVSKKFDGVTISKSALEKFYSGCAHRYLEYRQWNLKEKYMPAPLKKGIAAHHAIEKLINGGDVETIAEKHGAIAIGVAERAVNWLEKNDYKVLATEEQHIAPLTKDIQFYGVIDVVAEAPNGDYLLIDWKTSFKPWQIRTLESGEKIYIDAQGWQGPVYLTPPYSSDIIRVEDWPIQMLYVVIPTTGSIGEYPYYKNDHDDEALLRTCRQFSEAKAAGNFPKNKGWQCRNCDFLHSCWKTKGWEKYYEAR